MKDSRYWIGVNLHSQVIQVCVLDAQGDVVLEERCTGGGLAEGQKLGRELALRFAGAEVVVEALGCNRWFVAACQAVGLKVTVAMPPSFSSRWPVGRRIVGMPLSWLAGCA